MPKREQLLNDLQGDKDFGVLLAVQMDGVPETIQLVVLTGVLDEAAGGLREKNKYVIRALGVNEHRVSVGMFGNLRLQEDDHPLLFQYNAPPVAVFFRGEMDGVNMAELVLDISQAHASTFGQWRDLAAYINTNQPLVDLLESGGGLLGQMPKPLAERMGKVFEHHNVEHKLMEGELSETDEHGRSRKRKLLLLDDSYVVAFDFSVEELGRV